METKIHKFEERGLGPAPYTYLGHEDKVYNPIVNGGPVPADMPMLPGGTCAYCGTAIRECHWLRARNGKQFYVGSDCILKADDAGLKRIVNRERREAQVAREEKRIEVAKAAFEANSALFDALPHPIAYRATALGERASSYIEWMFRCAGHRGRLEAARFVEKILGK